MTTEDRTPGLEDSLWGEDAWELCRSCSGRIALELTIRCIDCDGPFCPVCVVQSRESAEVTCRECGPENREVVS